MAKGPKQRGGAQQPLALERASQAPLWVVRLPPKLKARIEKLSDVLHREALISNMSQPQMVEWLINKTLAMLEGKRAAGDGGDGSGGA